MNTDKIPPSVMPLLYRMALEDTDRLFMVFGSADNEARFPSLDIRMLDAFVMGYMAALDTDPEYETFLSWLHRSVQLGPLSWRDRALVAAGDHRSAVELFLDWVQAYGTSMRPAWFVELNSRPLPSLIVNGLGHPLEADVRKPEHMGGH